MARCEEPCGWGRGRAGPHRAPGAVPAGRLSSCGAQDTIGTLGSRERRGLAHRFESSVSLLCGEWGAEGHRGAGRGGTSPIAFRAEKPPRSLWGDS